jgi:phospholipid/cholesterol/gamma-HCH transport system substrate-binding protein
MAKLTSEAKVGLFVLVGFIILAFMSLRVGGLQFGRQKGYKVYAIFDSASGLKLNVPVEIAGVEVGRVMAVDLSDGKARVTLRIRPDVRLGEDASATIRTKGVLGDRYIELVPGSASAPRLADGGKIVRTTSPPDMDQLMAKLGEIGEDIRKVTGTLSQVLGGEEGASSLKEIIRNVRELSENLNRTVAQNMDHLDRIMSNFDRFSGDLKDLSGINKESINTIIANVRNSSEQLQGTIAAVHELTEKINKGEGTLGRLVNDPETAENLNATLTSLKDISERINRGEGSIGKLVNDADTVDNLNDALGGLNRYLNKEEQFKTFLDYRGEYLTDGHAVKSYVTLRIQPAVDKYYLLAIVDDPAGRKTTTDRTYTITENGQTTTRTEREVKVEKDSLKFSAQIAKRYYDLVVRGGIIESSGGLGLDYYLFDDKVRLTFEAFNFDPDTNPHLKLYADYTFLNHLFLTVGMDDFASEMGNESFFVGGGIRFMDEDLKYLLGRVPLPTNSQ